MEIIEFYDASDKQYWLEKINKPRRKRRGMKPSARIKECDWKAGKYLYELSSAEKLRTLALDTML